MSATSAYGSFHMSKPPGAGRIWYGSFGSYMLCLHQPGVRVVLQKAGWHTAPDAKPLHVQAWLRIVDPSTKPTTIFISANGRAWEHKERYPGRYTRKIAGTVVNRSCAELKRERSEKGQPEFTELVYVMKVDGRGGDLPRGYIDYLADDEPHRLMINWQMVMCGSAIRNRDPQPPDQQTHCGGPRATGRAA